jgi:hypothetical protein
MPNPESRIPKPESRSPNPEVVGIIDFGDMVQSWTIADPAVAIAYALLDASNPLATPVEIVRDITPNILFETRNSPRCFPSPACGSA